VDLYVFNEVKSLVPKIDEITKKINDLVKEHRGIYILSGPEKP
jgi:hypothetical protein